MACRKNSELFYGSCNTKLHFMSLNIISPSQYKRANRLGDYCQQRTLQMSASCYAFNELGCNLCLKILLALQEKLRVIFYTQVRVFFYYSRITRVNCMQYGVFSRVLRACNAAIYVARTVPKCSLVRAFCWSPIANFLYLGLVVQG